MDKDKLYLALYEFKNLAMDTQGQVTNKLHNILDWVETGVRSHTGQCVFCQHASHVEHADDCPTKLARDIREELEL